MADALDVGCPDCGAPPKTDCYTSAASTSGAVVHANRTDLAAIEHGTCALCSKALLRLDGRRWHRDGSKGCPPLPDPNTNWNAYARAVNESASAPGDPGDANFLSEHQVQERAILARHEAAVAESAKHPGVILIDGDNVTAVGIGQDPATLLAEHTRCPECRAGKHPNCDGTTLYPNDSMGPCTCADDAHNPPPDEEYPVEGCPDCGLDTVTDTPEGGVRCTSCGWAD